MGMVVRSNIMAVNSQRQLGMNNSQVSKALEKLSSGYRINRAGDDASGLAISEKMKAQIKGLDTASLNAQDGISLVQTAEGALTEVHNMLNRMTELATRSANGINEDLNRESLQKEVDKLQEEIDRISQSTNFNGIKLLDGSLGGGGKSVGALTGATIVDFKSATTDKTPGVNATGFTTGTETLTIDGVQVTIDWSKLSSDDQAALKKDWTKSDSTVSKADAQKAAQIIQDTINNALDELNVGAKHVEVIAFGNTDQAKSFKLSSTTEGSSNSEIIFGTAPANGTADTSTLLADFFGKGAGDVLSATQTLKDPDAMNGDFTLTIDGASYAITVAAGTITNTSEIADVATALKTAIDATIDNYNAAAGPDNQINKADITVDVTEDGRLKINNGTEYTIGFKDIIGGETAKALGISSEAKVSTGGLTLQIGDTADSFNQITVSVNDMSSKGIGVANVDISSVKGAQAAIDVVRSAIDKVSEQRAVLGATQNRLEYTINNLDTASENLQSANSRIRDTDMAKMMMEYTKMNVLTQSAQAMLAQANQQPQSVLQLLQ